MLRFFAPSVLTLLPFGQSRFEPSHFAFFAASRETLLLSTLINSR